MRFTTEASNFSLRPTRSRGVQGNTGTSRDESETHLGLYQRRGPAVSALVIT